MLTAKVRVSDAGLMTLIDSLDTVLDTTAILDEAGALLLNRIRTRFLAETDPEGNPWVQSQAAKRRRAKGGTGTLFATGNLFRSIQLSADGPNGRSINTDVPYARKHHLGLEGQVKREFLGFVEDDARVVEKLLQLRVEKVL